MSLNLCDSQFLRKLYNQDYNLIKKSPGSPLYYRDNIILVLMQLLLLMIHMNINILIKKQ